MGRARGFTRIRRLLVRCLSYALPDHALPRAVVVPIVTVHAYVCGWVGVCVSVHQVSLCACRLRVLSLCVRAVGKTVRAVAQVHIPVRSVDTRTH